MLEGGHHLILDLKGCSPRRLDSRRGIAGVCRELARVMRARVLETRSLRFAPQGVTAFSVLAESHISVHTWPESGKAFLDVFSCQERFAAEPVVARAVELLRAKRAEVLLVRRDAERARLLFNGRVESDGASFEFGRTILSFRSRFQRIELTRGPLGVSLFLDGYWQFVEAFERAYHETLVHPAALCAPRLRRVGIAGGGDGLALREVLKYPDLERVLMYEIDPAMLGLADGHPEMLRLNERSLRHPKATVVAADARRMLRPGAGFDLLIVDFPSMSEGTKLSHLYSLRFYRRARRALAPGGVLVAQVTDYPQTVEKVADTLRRLFSHVVPYGVGKSASMYNFVLASPEAWRPRRQLPSGLSFVTQRRLERLFRPGSGGRVEERRAS